MNDANDELTPEQKRALFEAYDKSRAKVVKASAEMDQAVKNIADQIGVGPFRWQGAELSIVKRGERITMRTNDSNVEEIG